MTGLLSKLLVNLFRKTHKVKTQQVEDKIRGQRCGDIKLVDYLTDDVGSVPLVLDLLIAHERWRSSLNPSLNVQLH